jgi:hypothetical protein
MRATSWFVGLVTLAAVGCGSRGSGDAGNAKDGPAQASPDAMAATDTAAKQDAAPLADVATKQDAAPLSDAAALADTARTPDAAPLSDAAPLADTARTPDAAPGSDVPQAQDTARLPDAVSLPDTARTPDGAAAPDLVPGAETGPAADAVPGKDATPDLAQPDVASDSTGPVTGRTLGGCPILPANHVFNTPIDNLPVHGSSAAFMTTIGNRNIHLDLGTTTVMASAEYYGIPYNTVAGNSLAWTAVHYGSTDPDMSWDPFSESDCVDQSSASAHTIISPCSASKAPKPWLPIPASPLVEGGIDTTPSQPYGDHHMLIIDSDVCRLWELYHCYPNTSGGWDIFNSSTWDLDSNALRPADWTSADAAGFPILPLLLLEKEASSGEIKHALRFTINSSSIRNEYIWPARHLTTNGSMSASKPPMGQLFRIKASYQIPTTYNTQSRAILQALKTYGMYIADGGSNMYIQGDPSASWQEDTFSQVQSVGSSQFEAVDLGPIMSRASFDPDSAAVPAP